MNQRQHDLERSARKKADSLITQLKAVKELADQV
jgi:hypothetical protein